MIDQVKPAALNKRELVIIYSGINGIQNKVPLKNYKLDKYYQEGR